MQDGNNAEKFFLELSVLASVCIKQQPTSTEFKACL